MILGKYYDAMELHRKEKIAYAHFLKPHRVLSTCRVNGGLREDIDFLYNHQCCEPSAHIETDLHDSAVGDPPRYHKRIAKKAGIDSERSAGLATAANMNNLAISVHSYGGLEVVACCTAGVGTNGARAGDPATYHYTSEGYQSVSKKETPKHGTIITMLFINQELSPGAMLVAATMATEAKGSVLHERSAASKYSMGIATGTGTDQIGIASLLDSGVVHMDANKHSKLGELIGLTVRESLADALNLQCGMTPDSRRSCLVYLERYGETQNDFLGAVKTGLSEANQKLIESNFLSVNHDPLTVSAVQACVHLRDQIEWGVLPETCIQEVVLRSSWQIANAVSGKVLDRDEFCGRYDVEEVSLDADEFLNVVRKAFSIGFEMKWKDHFQD